MRKILIVLCVSLVLIGWIIRSANADTVTARFFYEGVDLDTGVTYKDPTILIVFQGAPKDIDELLKPDDFMPDFDPSVDFYFEFDPTLGTSLVFVSDDQMDIVGLSTKFEDIPFEDVDDTMMASLTPDDIIFDLPIDILLNDNPTLILLLADDVYIKIGNFEQDGWKERVEVQKEPEKVIPEPSTLLLIGLGLLGLMGIVKWRENWKRGMKWIMKTLFLLMIIIGITGVLFAGGVQPIAAQTFNCNSVTEILNYECEALVALYNSTDGDNWTNNSNWLQTNTPCDWYGVTCNDFGPMTVIGLSLNENQLRGNIPSELENLANLQSLDLNINHLRGTIPPQLGNFLNLQNLDLSANQLRGSIPTELGSLGNLQRLDLGENQLAGSIPVEFEDLTNLEYLELNDNKLGGDIPTELGDLGNLVRLDLSFNQLSGNIPPELGNLVDLQYLYLGRNQLSGSIPTQLGALVDLKQLSLDNNQLTGSIPTEIGNLTELERLWLYKNQLSGSIPTQLGGLFSLEILALDYNQLSGNVPSELGSLSNLQELWLRSNQLSGPLPTTLTNLTLKDFHFNDTNLCEPSETDFQSWLAEDVMYLTRNGSICLAADACNGVQGISEDECQALVTLYNTTSGDNWSDNSGWGQTNTPCSDWYGVTCSGNSVAGLSLIDNRLSGSIPSELGNLTNLRALSLMGNQLTGSIPPELSSLPNLRTLDLLDNQLSGSIPSELGNLTNLQQLALGGDQLSGIIPPELGNLTNLQDLVLMGNQLTGSIPPELGNLTNLRQLGLVYSQLGGSIPPELGNLTNLQVLVLMGNQLSGSIPPELGNLVNLQKLYLNDNQLSGSLPASLTNLTSLEEFHFNNTNLCEPQDTDFQNWLNDIVNRGGEWNGTGMACLSSATCTDISQAECDALVALYNSTSGDNWTDNTGWKTDTPCNWYGVTCDGGNVVRLDLNDNQLSGFIPPEIGDLTDLWWGLYLHNNQLHGSVPSELGNLTNLQDLALNDNQFSGSIPTALGSLTELRNLWLHNNQFEGTLPDLSSLTELQSLWLYNNQLTGSIPSWLGSLTQLQKLSLGSNQFSGSIPATLGSLTNLDEFYLYNNQLTGGIPSTFSNLTNLKILSLADNQLDGEIPSAFGTFTDLQELYLHGNQFTGNIPWQLGNLSELQLLYLFDNQLSGSIPSQLGSLDKLESLKLYDNQLDGNIPSELGGLSSLKELHLYNNELNGNIPSALGSLSNLQALSLVNNQLAGEIPAVLGSLNSLEELDLYDNQFTGNIPSTLGNLGFLKKLVLGNNQLDGEIPSELGGLQDLEILDVQYNNLDGIIPQEIGDLENLRELYLDGNKLTGNIPLELGGLENLEILYLSENQLTGEIPPEIANLTNLNTLWIGSNQFTGTIPPELGNLTNLLFLDLGGNQLTGSVPAELGNLTNLEVLYLWFNQLVGSLPTYLTNLTSLQSFRFSGTNLCEPQDTRFRTWLADIPDVQSVGVACENDFPYDDSGDRTWHDVEQDDEYCWAAAASNVLAWTEWGTPVLDSVEKIFGDFRSHWTPGNGLMKYGWWWWFDEDAAETPSGGEWEWAQVDVPGGGNHWPEPEYNFLDYYEYWGNWEAMEGIEYYLDNGYGVSITAYPDFGTTPGHAFAVWGIESHPDGMGTGLWITDSEDSEHKLDRFSLRYDPDSSLWYINDGDYRGWYIGGVQALNRRDSLNEPDTFVIAAISAPQGGISPNGNISVEAGQNQIFTITPPDAGLSLQELLVDGEDKKEDCIETTPGTCQYTFTNVSDDHWIEAIFLTESEMATVTASAGSGGSISFEGDVKVEEGEDLTFTITPDPGYRIMDVIVDGESQGPAISYTLEDITEDHNVEVVFTEKTDLLAVVAKRCFEVDENGQETEIACNEEVNATVIVGDLVLEPDKEQFVVPFSKDKALIMKVIPVGDSYLARWETADGTIVEGEISTEEDLILRPVIRCHYH